MVVYRRVSFWNYAIITRYFFLWLLIIVVPLACRKQDEEYKGNSQDEEYKGNSYEETHGALVWTPGFSDPWIERAKRYPEVEIVEFANSSEVSTGNRLRAIPKEDIDDYVKGGSSVMIRVYISREEYIKRFKFLVETGDSNILNAYIEKKYELKDEMTSSNNNINDNVQMPRSLKTSNPFTTNKYNNVALGKPVSSSDENPILGKLNMITDGDKDKRPDFSTLVELSVLRQYIEIDLEAEYNIYGIVVLHYLNESRIYNDVIVKISKSQEFSDAITVFNNDLDNSSQLGVGKDYEYVESSGGKVIIVNNIRGRYVRLYSNGNNRNDLNHYVEVEVYTKNK